MKYPKWTIKQAIDRVREKLNKQGRRCVKPKDEFVCALYDNVNACNRCAIGWLIPRDKLRRKDVLQGQGSYMSREQFPEYLGDLNDNFLEELQRAHDSRYEDSASWLDGLNCSLDRIEREYLV